MHYPLKSIFFIVLGLMIGSCNATRFIEPIEKGDLAIGIHSGGPLIEFGGTPIPVPLSSLEVGYGLKENTTVFGGLHTTALLFGNFQMDIGSTFKVLSQKKYTPNISVSPAINTIWDITDKKAKIWPILDLNCYWHYGERKNYFYVGLNNYFELSSRKALGQRQEYPILFSPQIGHILKGKDHKWEFTAEIKFLAPYIQSTYSFVPYTGLTREHGATGVYLGYRRYFSLPSKKQ